jgi:hypothetical protein
MHVVGSRQASPCIRSWDWSRGLGRTPPGYKFIFSHSILYPYAAPNRQSIFCSVKDAEIEPVTVEAWYRFNLKVAFNH